MTGFAGVILAGGEGSRMGGADKALLMLGGVTLIERVADRLRPQAGQMAISANGDPARFAFTGLPVLQDERRMGPLAGLLAGLVWARAGGADAVVTAAVDTPFFPDDLVARLQAAGAPAVAMSGGRMHPTFGFWPVSLEPLLRAALDAGKAKLMRFAEAAGAATVEFEAGGDDPFRNLNTPGDLALAERALAG